MAHAPGTEKLLAAAREAARRGDWSTCYEQVANLDLDNLEGPDLLLVADAAWWTLELEASMAARQRAYRSFAGAGDHQRAAWCGWFLWFDYRFKGDTAVASSWLRRAERHLEGDRSGEAAGYVLVATATAALDRGDLAGANHLAVEALTEGRRIGSADVVALATETLGRVAIDEGRSDEGRTLLDDAMCSVVAGELSPLASGLLFCDVLTTCMEQADLKRAAEWTTVALAWCDAQSTITPYHGVCRVHGVEVRALQGQWAEAEADGVRACDELIRLEPAAAGHAYYAIGDIRRRRGDLAGADKAFSRANELGRWPQPGLALLRLAQGRHDDARSLLSVRAGDLPTALLSRCEMLAAQVEVAIAVGDLEGAEEAAGVLGEEAEGREPLLGAIAASAAARLALSRMDAGAALAHATRAVEGFRALGLPHEIGRALVVRAQAAQAQGDSESARLDLDAACAALESLGAVADLRAVAEIRGEAAARPAGLTPREVEVLRLVATGLTDRQIAEALALSEHTVGRHLQNIFTKIGVATRAAATSFAYSHGLV